MLLAFVSKRQHPRVRSKSISIDYYGKRCSYSKARSYWLMRARSSMSTVNGYIYSVVSRIADHNRGFD